MHQSSALGLFRGKERVQGLNPGVSAGQQTMTSRIGRCSNQPGPNNDAARSIPTDRLERLTKKRSFGMSYLISPKMSLRSIMKVILLVLPWSDPLLDSGGNLSSAWVKIIMIIFLFFFFFRYDFTLIRLVPKVVVCDHDQAERYKFFFFFFSFPFFPRYSRPGRLLGRMYPHRGSHRPMTRNDS